MKHILTVLYLYSLSLSAIPIEYRTFKGAESRPYLPRIAELTVKLLQAYPFLYQPEGGAEAEDVDCFYNSPDTIMVGAFQDKQLVATVIGLPLEQFEDKPCGFYPQQALGHLLPTLRGYFYVALLLVEKAYQHQGVAQELMRQLENSVTATHQYTHMCALVLEPDYHAHPAPRDYDYYYEQSYQRYLQEHHWIKHERIAYMQGSTPGMRLWSVPLQ